MINLYETADGVMVHPQSLTVEQALDLYQRGVLCAVDERHLSHAARAAVHERMRRAVPRCRRGRVVVQWGVRRPVRAFVGRA